MKIWSLQIVRNGIYPLPPCLHASQRLYSWSIVNSNSDSEHQSSLELPEFTWSKIYWISTWNSSWYLILVSDKPIIENEWWRSNNKLHRGSKFADKILIFKWRAENDLLLSIFVTSSLAWNSDWPIYLHLWPQFQFSFLAVAISNPYFHSHSNSKPVAAGIYIAQGRLWHLSVLVLHSKLLVTVKTGFNFSSN